MAIKHLARLHETIVTGGVPIVGVDANGIVSPSGLQAPAQPFINAFDDSDSAQLAFENTDARGTANTDLDSNKDSIHKLLRASAHVLLDEFNLHALKINAILDAVDGAATLAALKAAIAAIPDYPQRTFAQVNSAIKAKINSGVVD